MAIKRQTMVRRTVRISGEGSKFRTELLEMYAIPAKRTFKDDAMHMSGAEKTMFFLTAVAIGLTIFLGLGGIN